MQALMRPPPGATVLQNCAISGLQALAAPIAPGFICAIAPAVESNKMVAIVRTFFNIVGTFISPFWLSSMRILPAELGQRRPQWGAGDLKQPLEGPVEFQDHKSRTGNRQRTDEQDSDHRPVSR